MEEKNEKAFSPEELAMIKVFESLKGTPLSLDERIFVGDIPKRMVNRFGDFEEDGEG